MQTSRGWILLNMGMGGEVLLLDRTKLPEKHRLIVDFSDGTCLSINFWWFGYFHSAQPGAAEENLFMASPWYYFLLVSAFGTLSMICFLCQLFARPESGEARD